MPDNAATSPGAAPDPIDPDPIDPDPIDMAEARRRMVEQQLRRRDIDDPRVLEAMAAVPREVFVPERLGRVAYADGPLPIGEGQTISQPYVVALMAQAAMIGPDARVLDVGTGSGYGAAVLARLAAEVYTVERVAGLARRAEAAFHRLGLERIRIRVCDGSRGWPEAAPFDAILVAAAAPSVPKALLGQLAEGGRLVIPVGALDDGQSLLRITRSGPDRYQRDSLGPVAFVPLIGEPG